MRHGFRHILGRTPSLLVILGLLVAVAPGCGGDELEKQTEANGGVPPALKKSNDAMENFMKSKQAAKKK